MEHPPPRSFVPLEKRLFPLQFLEYPVTLENAVVKIEGLNSPFFDTLPNVFPTVDYPELQIVMPTHSSRAKIVSKDNGVLLLCRNGFIVIMGFKSVDDPPFWKPIVEKLLPDQSLPEDWYSQPIAHLYSGNFGHPINLGKFAAFHEDICRYDPARFSGCTVRVNYDARSLIIVFSSGRFVLFLHPNPNVGEIFNLLNTLYNYTEYTSSSLRAEDEDLAKLFQEKLQVNPDCCADLSLAMEDLALDNKRPHPYTKPVKMNMVERIAEYRHWQKQATETPQ